MVRSLLVLALNAAACGSAWAPAAQEPVPRYAYVVGCDGIVDKVDTVANALVRSVDVGRQLPIDRNQFHSGTFDSCLIGNALYVARKSAFYAVVPDRYSDPDRVFAFRFSLPDLRWRKVFDVGAFDGDGYTALAMTPAGEVRTATSADGVPPFFDPSTFRTFTSSADSEKPLMSVLGRSSEALLLWTPYLDRPGSFAVADIRAQTVVKLALPTGTGRNSVHLVPGGAHVYVEAATRVPGRSGEGERWEKAGRAQLYDAVSGKKIRDFADRRIATMTLQGISPSGKAIYGKGHRYFLLNLGRVFPNRTVDTAPSPRANSIFFADR